MNSPIGLLISSFSFGFNFGEQEEGMVRATIIGQRGEELAAVANYRVRKLAGLCGLSIRQLQRDFRRHLGTTAQAWLNERRLQLARARLLGGEPVKVVALDLGFKHVPNFCEWFKAESG